LYGGPAQATAADARFKDDGRSGGEALRINVEVESAGNFDVPAGRWIAARIEVIARRLKQ
jgi:hypothetical protein